MMVLADGRFENVFEVFFCLGKVLVLFDEIEIFEQLEILPVVFLINTLICDGGALDKNQIILYFQTSTRLSCYGEL